MTSRHFLFHAIDRPGSLALRESLREAHRASIRRVVPDCRCVLGGPLLDDEERMMGTVLVFEAASEEAVAAFMATDPYLLADLFDRVEIRAWRVGLGSIA